MFFFKFLPTPGKQQYFEISEMTTHTPMNHSHAPTIIDESGGISTLALSFRPERNFAPLTRG
jgi:hypothetical protein